MTNKICLYIAWMKYPCFLFILITDDYDILQTSFRPREVLNHARTNSDYTYNLRCEPRSEAMFVWNWKIYHLNNNSDVHPFVKLIVLNRTLIQEI